MTVRFIPDRSANRVFGRMINTGNSTKRGLRQGMFNIGYALIKEGNRQVLNLPKTGRIYRIRRGRQVRRHQASAPFESHANLSGTLRRSLSFQLSGVKSITFGYGVSGSLSDPAPEYARFVEFGTRRMAPRPTLLNSLRAQEGNNVQRLQQAIMRELR